MGNRLTLNNNKKSEYNHTKAVAALTIGFSKQMGSEQVLEMI